METSDIVFEFKNRIDRVKDNHFLKYFFSKQYYPLHPLLSSLSLTLGVVNEVSDGYADEMIKRIVSLKGTTTPVLEGIMAIFSEILVASHAVNINKNEENVYFETEPGLREKKKNPEFRTIYKGIPYCAEVKKPNLIEHQKTRKREIHLPARLSFKLEDDPDKITYPKDNPIKDFLISSQLKFEHYIEKYPDDYRLLFIMWDNHMYEPISSLTHPYQGLFTDNSFYKDGEGKPIKFPLIDGVIIVSHLHHFNSALNERPFIDRINHAFQYTREVPWHAFIQNPYGRKVPENLIRCFECVTEDYFPYMADYSPTDFIFWI